MSIQIQIALALLLFVATVKLTIERLRADRTRDL